uniref:RING-type domain-containing protein n=1 Tax=Cuerna arida TaxID=1464854 RepID=A0A1B6F452_9HEMI
MPDESRPPEESTFWADDELETPDPRIEFLWTEKKASCQGRLLCKKQSIKSKRSLKFQSSGLRNKSTNVPKRELLEKKKSENSSSSSGSDSVVLQISEVTYSCFPVPSGYQPIGQTANSGNQIWNFYTNKCEERGIESSGSGNSSSLQENCNCVVCGEKVNTCVMHHHQRHLNFCEGCATNCFHDSAICPICPQRIVYIYKYKDI